jgi:hypothetical protein
MFRPLGEAPLPYTTASMGKLKEPRKSEKREDWIQEQRIYFYRPLKVNQGLSELLVSGLAPNEMHELHLLANRAPLRVRSVKPCFLCENPLMAASLPVQLLLAACGSR